MNAAARAKAILIDPVAEWTKIQHESGDLAYLLSRYVAVLALVPALCGLVGTSVIGVVVPGIGTVRTPIFDGLFGAVFGYVVTVVTVLSARGPDQSAGAAVRRAKRLRQRRQARGLFLYAGVAERDFSAAAGLALPRSHRLLRRLCAVVRPAAADEIRPAEIVALCRRHRRLRRRADVFRRDRATRHLRHAGALTTAPSRRPCRRPASRQA